ncbi:uncharacterized protein LOC128515183 isoform X2 [Clarias gariepinus]|uniref:uncharacterized protein LOC128515183 isoform X2 n=1 Tax=Clarias gariepinus TaxID=13013 RepID=UPI00234DAD53|nr:uncharacterized protein LOC128515183 isoform X2 [Clarias gariepinus]
MTNYFQLINPFLRFFFERILQTNVYFEYHDHENIQKVRSAFIKRVCRLLDVISVSKEKECDVKVVFCPIVSRAGTDIEAALLRLALEKPTIVFVLHHTFDPDYNAPSSSRYEKNKLMLVDLLFHEDSGMLKCLKNDEAFSKTERYLKRYAKVQHVVSTNEERKVNY